MRYGLTVADDPELNEPVSTADAKTHLRTDTDDAYIDSLVIAARVVAEAHTGRAFLTQTFTLTIDQFPPDERVIVLPRAPVVSIGSVTYVDDNGDTQTLASSKYQLDVSSIEARVAPAYGETWPGTREQLNAVSIEFDAGYGQQASSVPAPIVHAIKLMIGTYYDPVRATVSPGVSMSKIPHAAEYLLAPFVVPTAAGLGV